MVIAEEGSITLAAQRLGIRQPTATAALKRIEQTLGYQLIERGSRHFQLTQHGEVLLQEGTRINRRISRISGKLAECDSGTTGTLNLLLVTSIRSRLIDESIRLLHQRHPNVGLKIQVASSHEIVSIVRQGRAPFGICLLLKPLGTLDCRFLLREEFVIVCGEEHPLHGRTDLVYGDLIGEGFVSFTCAEEGWGLEPMIALREGTGLGARVVGQSSQLDEVRRMIIAGMGIGILPLAAVRSDLRRSLLWRLPGPAPDESLGADLYFVMQPDQKLESLELMFLNIIKEVLACALD